MRPAQKAPENSTRIRTGHQDHRSFNEAGAKSAGKQSRILFSLAGFPCFNEAGAKSAGKHGFARYYNKKTAALQ